jgi:hypothetical protein
MIFAALRRGFGSRRPWAPAFLIPALMTMALALGIAGAPVAACERGLTVTGFPDGATLAEIKLGETGSDAYDFSTVYLHSVTLTPVESRYRLAAGGIHQTAELFQQHGPGLASEAVEAGTVWRHADGWFLIEVDRTFEHIVMRVAGAYRNRLIGGGNIVDLTRWGDRALELRPRSCTGEQD